MADQGGAASDTQLFELLSNLLHQVETLTNQEDVDLRSKIEALGLEVTKVPSKSPKHLHEDEIATELDKLSAKLDNVNSMIVNSEPEVQSLLSGTADLWMPVITANAQQRRNFTGPVAVGGDDLSKPKNGESPGPN